MYPISSVIPNDVPSSLELLTIPFAFSQKRLLHVSRFVSEAKKRGFDLNRQTLEWLDRRRILIPLFRTYSRRVEPSKDPRPEQQFLGPSWQLYQASEAGRLRDPALTRFRPWPGVRSYGRMLYSSFQLLGLRQLDDILGQFTARRVNTRIKWDLPRVSSEDVETALQTRALTIVLEILSPRYTPRILGRIRSSGSAEQIHTHTWSAPDVERDLLSGIDPKVLLEQAEHWLIHARRFDPLGDWHQVVRVATPTRWEDLRFDALNAIELRIAAEMFLRYCEDLVEVGCSEPLPEFSTIMNEPRYDRLKTDYPERAKTIQRYRLENSPAVAVVVEGYTEMKILPRILELFDAGPSTGLVEFINLKGISGNIELVAQSVAVPKLDTESPDKGRLLRSLTGLVVAVDPEGRYSSPEKVEQQRTNMIDEILTSLPVDFQTAALRSDLEHLVVVKTWGEGGCFEFANFTDQELALAIQNLSQKLPDDVRRKVPDRTGIEKELAVRRNLGKDIKTVWGKWDCCFSKVALAEETWPILRSKVTSEDALKLPVVQVAQTIINLAYKVRPVTHLVTDDEDA